MEGIAWRELDGGNWIGETKRREWTRLRIVKEGEKVRSRSRDPRMAVYTIHHTLYNTLYIPMHGGIHWPQCTIHYILYTIHYIPIHGKGRKSHK
jgi:hypothetical protein